MSDVSVVIVTHNALPWIEQSLASVQGVEAVVVDNASADGSADAVERAHPKVHLIRNSDNRGFAPAANQGMAAGHAPWVLLLNPDTVVPADAIARMLETTRKTVEAYQQNVLLLLIRKHRAISGNTI